MIEALLWLWRGDGLRAQPWLTLASYWATTREDFDELAVYVGRAKGLCDAALWRQYHRGALQVARECAPRPAWLRTQK